MDEGVSSILFMILLQIVLIGLNAVFACAEIAIISMNDNKLAKMAAGYESSVKIMFNDKAFDAKSVMFLMSACIKFNSEIELVCDGPDEEKALEELSAFLESDMGD